MSESKQDKRKETSSKNLAKAREAKLNKLKEKKSKQEYYIEEVASSDSESSDEDVLVVKKGGREKKETEDKYRDELSEIKQLIASLAIKNKYETKTTKAGSSNN